MIQIARLLDGLPMDSGHSGVPFPQIRCGRFLVAGITFSSRRHVGVSAQAKAGGSAGSMSTEDCEMSFVCQDDVLQLFEGMIRQIFKSHLVSNSCVVGPRWYM